MKKFLPFLIILSILFPLMAQAGFFDVVGGILQDILCILTGIACPDPCLRLLSEIGTAAYGICRLVDRISSALYLIGWSLALVIILWGGISYMVSGGEEEKMKKAKNIIKSGLIGAGIIVCSGSILTLLLEFLGPLFYY